MGTCTTILTGEEVKRTLDRLAFQVLERHGKCEKLVVVGIQRRGVDLAARITEILIKQLGTSVETGALDINLYRDDWTKLDNQPMINTTELPASGIDGCDILLVDDVLFSGRTIRAALEAILDYGRPRRVELLVLVDRGHRELPIHADYIGKSLNTGSNEHVDVMVDERDGKDEVCLVQK